jgi:hypothetical protein
MSTLKEYTLEIYRKDKRIKRKDRYSKSKPGLRYVTSIDFAESTKDYIQTVVEQKENLGFTVEVFETYVTRKNLMNGAEYKERYDTPYYCSPSSETFWSM